MSYDVFLSHSHRDKVWTHDLYERLATTDYNGRMLRAWLDERVLDPGNLSSARELESALDRSRKLRSTALVDALLHALVEWGGDASHAAAAAAISTAFDERDPVVFYTEGLKRAALDAKAPPPRPPLPRTVRLLLDPDTRLGRNTHVAEDVLRSREDFTRAFGAGQPNGIWPELVDAPPATKLENGPLVGTVRRVTLANMESFADRLGPTDIACLTEPRIVDALLDGAGGYLIDDQQADAPLGTRLRVRGVRFATYERHILEQFKDGDVLAMWPSPTGLPPTGFAVGAG